jgi:transcriptional regulator with XRE-family HTH domain
VVNQFPNCRELHLESKVSKETTAGKNAESADERSGVSEQRRRELADFLRTRREKIKPEQVGIMHLSRRRTPGLRREEVAELAGVGTTWYTWLEQARDIQPSSEVLRRLSSALRMNSAETKHLYALAGKAQSAGPDLSEENPSKSLLKFLNEGIKHPAFLIGARWDILAVNEPVAKGTPQINELAKIRGNYVHYVLTTSKDHVEDWEDGCRRLLAQFRASLGDSVDHPWVNEIIEKLRRDCPQFEGWWREHDVHDHSPALIRLKSKELGTGRYERMVLTSTENPRLKFLVFSPLD